MFKSNPEAAAAVSVAMDSGRLLGEVGVLMGEVSLTCRNEKEKNTEKEVNSRPYALARHLITNSPTRHRPPMMVFYVGKEGKNDG